MARVLIVYHRDPFGRYWRPTYTSHLTSFERFTDHEVFYLNTAWLRVPKYLKTLDPDLVIFHYTFLAVRLYTHVWEAALGRIDFLRELECPKAIVPHDEQARSDRLCEISRDFGVTHVFSPASGSALPLIYEGLDFDRVAFHRVLTGYVDEETVIAIAERAAAPHVRTIDIGYRAWASWPFYGRHGRLKTEIGERVAGRAPAFGLVTDISRDPRDALLGDVWFDFLLSCKYTIGCEGGSSVLDRDGTVAECVTAYLEEHPGAPFEEVEAACFPGLDGRFEYRLLGPRHFEAVLTRTCQVLIEGEYGGALTAGVHYIPLRQDFSNLDEVLEAITHDDLRGEMVERAYQDVIASGAWTYRAFAEAVLGDMLAGVYSAAARDARESERLVRRNRRHNTVEWSQRQTRLLRLLGLVPALRYRLGLYRRELRTPREWVRDMAVLVIGEERLWNLMIGVHRLGRRLLGRPPVEYGAYTPTEAELSRRERARKANGGD